MVVRETQRGAAAADKRNYAAGFGWQGGAFGGVFAAGPAPPAPRMLESQPLLRRPSFVVFVAASLVALAFALYTQHVWEDYYITFRTSKHLATGNGLVFNVGDRLHTFTSPLGVLLPALASVLTLNRSDDAALWIFRLLSIAAFAGGVAVLFLAVRGLRYPLVASLFVASCLATDAKNVDFAINGMESPYLLLFFAYTFWATFSPLARRWLHLGLAWGGLMWTRPDSFIYIALFSAAIWLFNEPARTGVSRLGWFKVFAGAAVVAAAVYLPWFAFAWAYYGSPVPQPVVAKALQTGPKTLLGLGDALLGFPQSIKSPYGALHQMFAPTYAIFGGWPMGVRWFGFVLSGVCALLWLVAPLRAETKAASLTFFGASLYLTYYPPQAFPWYLCLPTTLGFLALAGALAQGWDAARTAKPAWVTRLAHTLWLAPAAMILVVGLWCTLASATQLRAQQTLIETGTRRQIGEWLHHNALPTDTVFLEPLGYIGYFSGLKTYDYPGLSSREMIAALRRVGPQWSALIRELRPTWLVLRPVEIDTIVAEDPQLLGPHYACVREFNVRDLVLRSDIEGRDYLLIDSVFSVWRRND